jgi:DNA-binding GntR family transcriptional regulator
MSRHLNKPPAPMPSPSVKKSHVDLARRIVDFVQVQDYAAGRHLAEQALADRFGVSRSPVRSALKLLADRDVVRYASNQGYFLARPGRALDAGLIAMPSADEDALFIAIVRDRFAGRLGDRFTVTALIRRYGASRALVGRVVTRLGAEGLIERGAGQGWRFRAGLTDPGAYDDSYRFRMLIEPAAIREPGFRPDPDRFAQVRRLHDDLVAGAVYRVPLGRLIEIDVGFHDVIAACSGNRFFAETIRQQNRLRRLSDYQHEDERDRWRDSAGEHLSILDAIEAGDRDRAATLMRDHIAISRDVRPAFAAP